MDFAYFIENSNENYIDNTKLFSAIRDLYIDENEVFIDVEGSREELVKLLNTVDYNDRIVVRSVVDLSDTAKELINVLYDLQESGIILYSIEEPILSDNSDYYAALKEFVRMTKCYSEKMRKQGYKEAHEAGKVGRPKLTAEIEQATKLYKTRAFTIAEIENLTKISKSTLYRYLKDVDREE